MMERSRAQMQMPNGLALRIDPRPDDAAMERLWRAAWGVEWRGDMERLRAHSLVQLGAYDGERLVGYVNVASDGGIHAFLLDTTVHPDFQRRGIATALVQAAVAEARRRGAGWLHVDYEPQLEAFYRGCGFRPTTAGLMSLT